MIGTPGSDAFLFQGQNQQFTMTIVNAYSGEAIYINDTKTVNIGTYDGQGGDDFLLMTQDGDVLFLTDANDIQVINSVEFILGQSRPDVISLDHPFFTYNDVFVDGSQGDDIIWGNVGDDLLNGGINDDLVDGGPGNDQISGGRGIDQLSGGEGNDTISGNEDSDEIWGDSKTEDISGEDTVMDKVFVDAVVFPELIESVDIKDLTPSGEPSLGVVEGNLNVDFEATATLTFRDGFAGYNNSLGLYGIDENGQMVDASVLWGNVKTAGIDIGYQITLPVDNDGGEYGFFIIANGARVNGGYNGLDITDDGVVEFFFDYGGAGQRTATVFDNASDISLVYDDGVTVEILDGPVYHSTERGGTTNLNPDGYQHVVSGLAEEGNGEVLRIGFEDLPNLGDADFEDVLFDLDINAVTIAATTGNDALDGGDGDDFLYGQAGDDVLYGGSGIDELWGGTGDDMFLFQEFDGSVDVIKDFGYGGDSLNITDLLEGFDPGNGDDINDFVQFISNGGDTEVLVNADGDDGGAFTTIALVEGGINATVNALYASGDLVTDTSYQFSGFFYP